ncbi:hypothetical protein [Brevundimonas sp. NIBR10]|uniref:hypothetical protein n=1 Tax=Brevundimonas sp. NIBR10 TaxID=3015997 RepID=UPI0022F14EB2|nr:hypothetical protein [Brevundimonas sp. NIBR10]
MNESTPIADLWAAYEAATIAERKAWDRMVRIESQHGEAEAGFRHPRVVVADAIYFEASARKAALRKVILSRPVRSQEGMAVLRDMARDLTSGRYVPGDVRTALKAARGAGWRLAA